MITITDVAKACGVSRATVSKALNGAPDIAPATAERIQKQARALGYLPNATARALKVGKSYNIGVLFSDATGGWRSLPGTGLGQRAHIRTTSYAP